MTLVIRPTTNGFAIDDGQGQMLSECPCCGKILTQKAAETIVKKIEEGNLTMADARLLLALNKAIRAI
jgi:hypothetical protein